MGVGEDMRLKDKIKELLFKEEIQRINKMEQSLTYEENRMRCAAIQLNNAEKEIEECRRLLTQFIDIGVNVGFHTEEHSWAVICIAGKQEYVKFLPLNSGDARDVLRFLKQFEYSRQIIDSPLAFKNILKNEFLER